MSPTAARCLNWRPTAFGPLRCTSSNEGGAPDGFCFDCLITVYLRHRPGGRPRAPEQRQAVRRAARVKSRGPANAHP